jgi:hypothetical protein
LANNGWKLDAVAGLAEHAADRIRRGQETQIERCTNSAREE